MITSSLFKVICVICFKVIRIASCSYTREWLSALASGQILKYDTETEVFSISKERFAMVMEGGMRGLYFTRFIRNYVPLMKSFPEGGPNGEYAATHA